MQVTVTRHVLSSRRRRRLSATLSALLLAIAFLLITTTWQIAAAAAICLLVLFRLYSLLTSVVWIWFDGAEFSALAEKNESVRGGASAESVLPVYRETGGDFYPFGVRAVALEAWRDRAPAGAQRVVRKMIYRCWKLYWFTPLWTVLIVVSTTALHPANDVVVRSLLFATCICLMLSATTIAAEAALSYVVFGSWSLAYHRFDVQSERSATELATFVGGAITALLGSATAMYFGAQAYAGFEDIPPDSSVAAPLARSFYYTLTALTGNGDPSPTSAGTFWIMAVTYVNAAAFVIIVVGLLFDSLGKPDPALRRKSTTGGGRLSRSTRSREDRHRT